MPAFVVAWLLFVHNWIALAGVSLVNSGFLLVGLSSGIHGEQALHGARCKLLRLITSLGFQRLSVESPRTAPT